MKFEGENIYRDTIKMINSVCEVQTSVGAKTADVKMCTGSGEQDIRYEAGCFSFDGKETITNMDHEIFLTTV